MFTSLGMSDASHLHVAVRRNAALDRRFQCTSSEAADHHARARIAKMIHHCRRTERASHSRGRRREERRRRVSLLRARRGMLNARGSAVCPKSRNASLICLYAQRHSRGGWWRRERRRHDDGEAQKRGVETGSSKHQHEGARARGRLHAETLGGPLACSVALVRSARAGAAPAAPRRAAPRDRAAGTRRPIG